MERERLGIVSAPRHLAPDLGALAVVYTVLFLGSLVVTEVMTGAHFPSPFEPPGTTQAFFTEHGKAVKIAAFLQFGAAVPLGIFAATAVSRLQFLGFNVAGVFITLLGGLAASVFGAISGLLQWVLGQSGITSQPAATRVLHLLAFATGGVGVRRAIRVADRPGYPSSAGSFDCCPLDHVVGARAGRAGGTVEPELDSHAGRFPASRSTFCRNVLDHWHGIQAATVSGGHTRQLAQSA